MAKGPEFVSIRKLLGESSQLGPYGKREFVYSIGSSRPTWCFAGERCVIRLVPARRKDWDP
jgi:hypothetical protein